VPVALVTQHSKRVRRVVLSSVACLVVSHFPYYFINGTIIGKKIIERKICVNVNVNTSSCEVKVK